jgi:DnaJ-domain-containing protein 1
MCTRAAGSAIVHARERLLVAGEEDSAVESAAKDEGVAKDDGAGRDLYSVLEVARSATDEEIRAAFRALAIENHPDKHPGDAKAALRFKRINAAYQVLRDPEKKEQYDQLTAPVEDLAGTALAKPGVIPPPGYVAPPLEPEIRRRRVRVRKRRPRAVLPILGLGVSAILLLVGAFLLDRHAADDGVGGSTASAQPAKPPSSASASTVRLLPTASSQEELAAVERSGRLVGGTRELVGTAGPAGPSLVAAPESSPTPGSSGRKVSGDRWEITVPDSWQDATPRDSREKAVIWQTPADGAGVRPSLRVVVKSVPGDAPSYFQELDRRLPRGVVVDSDGWEYDSKPDGLRRAGRIAIDGSPPQRFIEFVIVTRGRGYEVTCAGPDDAPATDALCAPILRTLEIK